MYPALPEDIETVFKIEPPLEKVEDGFGFWGVILRDKKEDKLQCHLCGKWYKGLSSHVNKSHKIHPREYKKEFGLPLTYPLVGRSVSRKLSTNATKQLLKTRGKHIKQAQLKAHTKETRKRRGKSLSYTYHSASYLNKKGICEQQLIKRILIVMEQTGKDKITATDLRKHDKQIESVLRRRYGGVNAFRKKHNLGLGETRQRVRLPSEETAIAIIREKAEILGRVPRPSDFIPSRSKTKQKISLPTIHKIFGSFRRALVISLGLDEKQVNTLIDKRESRPGLREVNPKPYMFLNQK